MTYENLPVAMIDRNPDQPRKAFDEEKLDELAASIAANGLLEPVIVRPHPDTQGRWFLIAGERRWRACQRAGVETVPARIMDVDEVAAYVLSVAENVNRDDMTVMEETDAFDQLVRYGKTVAEIARVFGKSTTFVETRLSFRALLPEIRKMVEAGQMGPWLARYVAQLEPGNQRVVANRWARGEFQHETEASEFAAALRDAEQAVGFFDIDEPTQEEREEHEKKVRKTRSMMERIEALSALLGELAAADPAELSEALGNDVGKRVTSMERIVRQATAAHLNTRKAQAHAQARTLRVRS